MRIIKKAMAALFGVCLLATSLSGCGALDGLPSGSTGAYDSSVTDRLEWQTDSTQEAVSDTDTASPRDYGSGSIIWNGITVPEWDGEHAWAELNGGEPFFDEAERQSMDGFEYYSDLDGLGRCGAAYANICTELMPTEERGDIGSVKPSGWHTVKYNDLISGNYLYNRCHLVGYQLAGENANERNLVTGTRYLNIEGMLPFENMVNDYVEAFENHVLYRVTPVFIDDELVCRGVVMEGYSVEDYGEGVCFCVFAYNVQPGIGIDYATGESWLLDGKADDGDAASQGGAARDFVLNTNSGKFHLPECRHAQEMSEQNRLELTQTLAAMLGAGYSPCGACRPDEEECNE